MKDLNQIGVLRFAKKPRIFMCLAVLAIRMHPDYPLVLVHNRDEFHDRPAETLASRGGNPEVWAGLDLPSQGYWLAVRADGSFGFVNNYRDWDLLKDGRPTRGVLVKDFIHGQESPEAYLNRLSPQADQFNPFNLILGRSISDIVFFNSLDKKIIPLKPGIYGLSNHRLDTPWPKLELAKQLFGNALREKNEGAFQKQLFELLKNDSRPNDDKLPDTKIGLEFERLLSSIFIASEKYGTVASTVILMKKDGSIIVREKSFGGCGKYLGEREHQFAAPTP